MAKKSVPGAEPAVLTRSVSRKYRTAEEILSMAEPQALRALADYDGPVQELLDLIIEAGDQADVPRAVASGWNRKARRIMNVIFKLNGVKTSYVVPADPAGPGFSKEDHA